MLKRFSGVQSSSAAQALKRIAENKPQLLVPHLDSLRPKLAGDMGTGYFSFSFFNGTGVIALDGFIVVMPGGGGGGVVVVMVIVIFLVLLVCGHSIVVVSVVDVFGVTGSFFVRHACPYSVISRVLLFVSVSSS